MGTTSNCLSTDGITEAELVETITYLAFYWMHVARVLLVLETKTFFLSQIPLLKGGNGPDHNRHAI